MADYLIHHSKQINIMDYQPLPTCPLAVARGHAFFAARRREAGGVRKAQVKGRFPLGMRLTEFGKGQFHFIGGAGGSQDVVVYIDIAELHAPADHPALEREAGLDFLEVRQAQP